MSASVWGSHHAREVVHFLADRLNGNGGTRGVSADALICAAVKGHVPARADSPRDIDDFTRCCEAFVRHLDADQAVVELALRDRDIRVDGMPRADARLEHDGVRLSFGSKWGPLVYETGEYDGVPWRRIPGWQCNLRAIALSMEALRKVDRYGVSKRGEQYRGWRAIPQTTGDFSSMTEQDARAVLAPWGGDVRRALFETHPDRGGDVTEFRKVMRARDLVG